MSDRQQLGFSFVELMVVMVLLALLAGTVTLGVGAYERQKTRAFIKDMTVVLNGMRLYSAECGMPVAVWRRDQTLVAQVLTSADMSEKKNTRVAPPFDTMNGQQDLVWQHLAVPLPDVPADMRFGVDVTGSVYQPDAAARQKQGVRQWSPMPHEGEVLFVWYGWHQAQATKVALYQKEVLLGHFGLGSDGRVVFE